MLKDPVFVRDDVGLVMFGEGYPRKISRGLYTVYNFDMGFFISFPPHLKHNCLGDFPHINENVHCYGVCDSPRQFLDLFEQTLENDERSFAVAFTHIQKDPNNKGKHDGWRWHKWGPYVGNGTPTTEYLDDEAGFAEGVWAYHIYQIDGKIITYS